MITKPVLVELLKMSAKDKVDQGHVLDLTDFESRVESAKTSFDALDTLANELDTLSIREDWTYCEPNDWEGIRAEMSPNAQEGYLVEPDLEDAAVRVKAGFIGSVCGCMVGKPIEFNPTLIQLKNAMEPLGEWPINDYICEAALKALGRRHGSAAETIREKIRYVAPDDDINYTVLGMVMLEKFGLELNQENVKREWGINVPPLFSWGPERLQVIRTAIDSLPGSARQITPQWTNTLNPGSELCGAVIRADAYGYACPGNPMLASHLGYIDASFTHHRTGIYSTQYIAAVIALCFLMKGNELGNDRLVPFEKALDYIPQNTRFHHIASDSLTRIKASKDWIEGYESVHKKYAEYSHCKVYQEIGTLINTLKYAENVGDGFCKQVCQGNDTDSFGATSGSILGVFFGQGHLESRWTDALNNEIHTSLADFHEQNLEGLTERISRLPAYIKGLVDTPATSVTPDDSAEVMDAPNDI